MSDPNATPGTVRVRFCPSPTGNPHVGMVRTALFNWAYARHTGGTFVFRIEDTDAARDSEESYQSLLDALRWLGLDWDEGPEVGGPHAPYRQSERMGIYTDTTARLVEAGHAYNCYCTPEELEAARELARAERRAPGYEGTCRDLEPAVVQGYRDEGRSSVVRFRMPDEDLGWDDLVRGPVVFKAEHVPDFVMVRAGGAPLYTLVNPLDDALMGITHVLRGEDLLSSTPRQLALHRALIDIGVSAGPVPSFGHLPYVMGEGNKKLSKRDPQAGLNLYREAGFLPEGLINYLALLGWSIGEDREFFSKNEMAEAFEISRVNASPARFDYKKALAINGDWIRALDAEELTLRLLPYLVDAGVLPAGPDEAMIAVVRNAVPLVSERMETLGQAPGMLGFLFTDAGPGTPPFEIDPEDATKILTPAAAPILEATLTAVEPLSEWTTPELEAALRTALIDGLGLKPKVAFGAVRVAITGRRVSPPLFESMELLGRERSLARIAAARAQIG